MIFETFSKLTGYPNYHEINKQIFIGDYVSSLDNQFLNQNKINVIVNCSKNLPLNPNNKINYRVSVKDDFTHASIIIMIKYLINIIPLLNKHLDKKDVILIHCRCGIQRSATVLAALLMYRYKISKLDAIKIIKNKRIITFLPGPNFNLALDMYEKYITK